MIRRILLGVSLCSVLGAFFFPPAFGHEVRPGYLEITETEKGQYSMLWKAPGRAGMVMKISPKLPAGCIDTQPPEKQKLPGSLVEKRQVTCGPEGLTGQTIAIDGLAATITDVLVRITYHDGQSQTELLKPHSPSFVVTGAQSRLNMAQSYIRFGIKHILYGIDHLLFVLGLLLLSRGWILLFKTITAFTVGHSISLALATFGVINVPEKPLSAVIALSIVFLASELVKAQKGKTSLTINYPWLVSFGFGLLHGLGFAGALVQLGLPEAAIPLALLFFNIGVEIGQIIFVSGILLLIASLSRMHIKLSGFWKPVPVYAMGSVAGFWFIQRLALLFP